MDDPGNNKAGNIVTFSGSNNHQQATLVYQQWLVENEGSDKISGSPQIDRRSS
jgi:hypothetical protein